MAVTSVNVVMSPLQRRSLVWLLDNDTTERGGLGWHQKPIVSLVLENRIDIRLDLRRERWSRLPNTQHLLDDLQLNPDVLWWLI